MGKTKEKVTACLDAENLQHVLTVRFSRKPPISESAALNLIVGEHRADCEGRQHLLSLLSGPVQVIDSSLGETESAMQSFAQGAK